MHFKYRMIAYRASRALGARAGAVKVIVPCGPAGSVPFGKQRSARALKRLLDSPICGYFYGWPNFVLMGQDWDCFVKQVSHWYRTAKNSS